MQHCHKRGIFMNRRKGKKNTKKVEIILLFLVQAWAPKLLTKELFFLRPRRSLARSLSFSFINVAVIINKIFTKVIWITCSTKTFKTQLYNTFWKDLRWSGNVSMAIPFEKIDSGKEININVRTKFRVVIQSHFYLCCSKRSCGFFWEWKGFFSCLRARHRPPFSVSAIVYNSRMFKSFLGDKSGWYFMVAQRFGTEI